MNYENKPREELINIKNAVDEALKKANKQYREELKKGKEEVYKIIGELIFLKINKSWEKIDVEDFYKKLLKLEAFKDISENTEKIQPKKIVKQYRSKLNIYKKYLKNKTQNDISSEKQTNIYDIKNL